MASTNPKTDPVEAAAPEPPQPDPASFDPPTPPPPAQPVEGAPKTISATATDDGFRTIIVTGAKDAKSGAYPYVDLQPYGSAAGDSIPTLPVANRGDLLWCLTPYGWVQLPIITTPAVTQKGAPDASS